MYLVLLCLVYILLNCAGIYLLRRFLKPRLRDEISVWMFSISLSLSLTFLLILLALSLFSHDIFTTVYLQTPYV